MNQIKQHSNQWYEIKSKLFGATDCASLLGHGYDNPDQIISNKVNKIDNRTVDYDPDTLKYMLRGTRYEPIVKSLYEKRHNVKIHETGLKIHPTYNWITASPDGLYYDDEKNPVLTEFKVRYDISHQSVPYKHWIQMQVQMEVWNIDKCIYCSNLLEEFTSEDEYRLEINRYSGAFGGSNHGIFTDDDGTHYWRLKEYQETVVLRDRDFFSRSLSVWNKAWDTIKKLCESGSNEQVAKKTKYDEDKVVVYPWMVNNYIRNDPLLDWLDMYGDKSLRDKTAGPFLSMIRTKHLEIASHVKSYFAKLYNQTGFIVNIDDNGHESYQTSDLTIEPDNITVSQQAVAKTREAIKNTVPIILNPCFSTDGPLGIKIEGHADLLIINRYIDTILGGEYSVDREDKYSLIRVKYSTINLRADGIHMLNNVKQKIYKAQLWLLNQALAKEQKYLSSQAYVIGRKYEYTRHSKKYKFNNAFEKVGVIDFSDDGVDAEYNNTLVCAINWLRHLRSPTSGLQYADPMNPSDLHPELYPNLKNHDDFPWSKYKKDIAIHIKDITLMYRCGPKVRDYVHQCGITKWTELKPDNIIFNAGKVKNQIMNFVKAQQEHYQPRQLDKIKVSAIEYYIDFEAISNMYDDFKTFPVAGDYSMIFLIGAVIVNNIKGTIQHHYYLIKKLDKKAEKNMVKDMLNDFKEICKPYNQKHIPLFFWGNAEKYMLDRALGKELNEYNLTLIDLCKIFRESSIIFPGQFGYGLKEVANIMQSNGMIQTKWEENEINNGLTAMVEALKHYQYRSDPVLANLYFKDVIHYNYVDCKVLQEIVYYFRTKNDTDE